MRKYIGMIWMFCWSIFALAQVNDTLDLIPKTDVGKIEEKIKSIKDTKKVRVYVNTLIEGESFQVLDPERTILLSLGKDKVSEMHVSLAFSQDIQIEEEQEKVDQILENASSLLLSGKIGDYVYQVLDDVELLLEKVEINEPVMVMQETKDKEFTKGLLFSLVLIGVLGLFVLTLMKYKRRKER